MSIAITSAGAGTGKTYHLCSIIAEALTTGIPKDKCHPKDLIKCRPGAFIATTFTKKAATELKERIRARLLTEGHHEEAMRVEEALVGTVHSVCARIVERFAFEAGISPRLRVLDEAFEKILLSQSIEQCSSLADIGEMERLCRRLGQTNTQTFESQWRDQIRAIISAARANDISASRLPEMAAQSIKEVFGLLPSPSKTDLGKPLIAAIEAAIKNIPLNEDETATTANCLKSLQQALADMRGGNLKWSDWCKLSKISAAKASQCDIFPINQAAAQYDQHPQLHADIEQYITRVFDLAAAAMGSYQDRKKARGALDYTDLEALTLELLDRAPVQACIRAEYDLLVVDEFQDTSPIQLALFVRLAGLVKVSHWVGDTKQAIYGFRGADPALMRAAEEKFAKGETLTESRRHRPQLVDFFNGLFPDVFKKTHEMQRSEVELKPYREEQSDMSPAIELWSLASGRLKKDGSPAAVKSAEADDCIVCGIRELKDSGMLVSDKTKQKETVEVLRPLRWGDIAILCYSNKKASAIAAKLIASGVPTARETKGLLSTPEAVLALACLRWLNDHRDSVATAEILSLETCRAIEDWLEDRLAWLKEKPSGHWGIDGGLKSRVISGMTSLRDRMSLLTPAELLDAVLIHGDISGIASQWGAECAANRRSNLEALRGLAAEYESECLSSGSAASHAGFLLWCGSLASSEEDTSAFDESADAVQVMTWHGSKGLEWPVVICLDLDDEPRPRIWNSPAVVPAASFDPDKPLAGRRIRFWPYPFGQQTKEVPLCENAATSKVGEAAAKEAECEQSRLQYVVMTRARDLLVFPQAGNKLHWFPEGVKCGIFDLPQKTPSEDKVSGIRRKVRCLAPVASAASTEPARSVTWFAEPQPPKQFPPSDLTPSKLPPVAQPCGGEEISYDSLIHIGSGNNDRAVGDAIHAVLAACLINQADLLPRTEKILEAHGVAANAAEIAAAATAFHDFIQARFQPQEILVEVPFSHWNADGQRIAGNMDLVLMTSDGAVLIDHKSYRGSDLVKNATGYSGQVAAYRDALAAHGHPVRSAWIHYCTQGKLVQVP